MKRLSLSSLILAAGVTVLTAMPLAAQVSEWHKLGEVKPEAKEVVRPARSVASRFLTRRGVVNPNAQIQPVIEGEFAVPDIKQTPERILHKTVENPRAHLYGVVPRHGMMELKEEAFLANINPKTLVCSPLYYGGHYAAALGNYEYMLEGAAYRDGKLYVCESSYQVPNFYNLWHIIDASTGNLERTINFGTNPQANPYAMTWDSEKDMFYLLTVTSEDANSHFVRVDPRDWSVTYVKDLGGNHFCPGIVYNPLDKQTYIFDLENIVYTLNPETGALTKAGELDADFELLMDSANAAMCYSPMDQQFVLVYRDASTNTNDLYMIDPETWETAYLGPIGGRSDVYISALLCPDDFANADAPELPGQMYFDFVKTATTGTIEFTVPALTYYGVEIPSTADVKTVITLNNDKEIYSANLKPGETVKQNFTLPEGLNDITLVCSLNGEQSPARRQFICIGNDNPKAPTDLKIAGKTLTWTAPDEVGQNNGWVDVNALTYNVYIDGKKQNTAPIKACTYELSATGNTADRSDISVVASANGKESEPAVLNTVFGNGFSVPFGMMPTKEQSELFTVEDLNNDYTVWNYTTFKDDTTKGGMLFTMSQINDADDWLFLPLINFDKDDMMYQLSFHIASAKKADSVQSFDIAIANAPSHDNILRTVYTVDEYTVTETGHTFSLNFCPPSAGPYFIGIHDRSTKNNEARGMFLNDFKVVALDGTSSAVPENPTNVEVIPAPLGAEAATLKITLPTVDLVGKALPANQDITATVTTGSKEAKGTGKPGQTISVDIDTSGFGFTNFNVVLSNANGSGMLTTYLQYIGLDCPLAPRNIRKKVSDDNYTMTISWDDPGSVGVNGGYVDVNNLLYEMYIRTGIQYTKVGSTYNKEIKYETNVDKQTSFVTGPVARNDAGISSYSKFVQEVLGKPYEMPALEEFNTVNFSYYPYSKATQDEYADSEWENMKAPSTLGLDGCIPVQGALVAYSGTGGPCHAKVRFPKVSTQGYEDINLTLRYWSYLYAPAFEVYARTNENQEESLVANVTARSLSAQWKEAVIKLAPEFVGKPWVEFSVKTKFNGPQENLVLDSWEISADCDYDLKLMGISGPEQVSVGNEVSYNVTVANAGHLRNSGKLVTELVQTNGTVVATDEASIPSLNSSQEFTRKVTFDLGGEFYGRGSFQIRSTVYANNDELPFNDSRNILVNVKDSQLPVISVLRGSLNTEQKPTLSWVPPTTTYGSFQDFEVEEPFQITDQIGAWKNIDADGLNPNRIGSDENTGIELKWPDSNLPCAWTVVDPYQWGFGLEDRLVPKSGNQYVMARSTQSPDEANPTQASDWLISPEVKGGTDISFMFSTLAGDFTEYVYLYYSNSGTNLDPANATQLVNGDFIRLRSYSKVGSEGWEECTYHLPDDAKYFALVYSSLDCLAAMIDDISFTPAKLENWTIDHYEIHRIIDGNDEVIADNFTDRRFIDETFPSDKRAIYYVKTYVNHNDRLIAGPRSNKVTVDGPQYDSVDTITALEGIYGGKNTITLEGYAGQTLNVYAADGRRIMTLTPQSDKARYEISNGIYVVTNGRGTAKVIVK
ncbi:MAG: choice-of-anchor J domain-containing protein [Muribaculaceae bacterium]|nr:choice-of-anchor J domain-containing protein [Muribaculaceae bacterium]